MRRLKILQILTSLGPGGAERLVLEMMPRFNPDAFDVRLAILLDDQRALDVYGHQGRSVDVFDMRGMGAPASLLALRRHVRQTVPDVIHAHMFHSLAAAAIATTGTRQLPALCFTSHCNELAFPPLRSAIVRALRGRRAADIVFVEGQHPPLNTDNVVVIPNGVDVPLAEPVRTPWEPGGPVQLVSIGRLADQKDPLGLIHIMAAIDNPHLKLDFYGEGPLETEMRDLIAQLNLGDRVQLKGLTRDVRTVMRKADILVMPSKFEGMPMAMLEAGSEAMPVVATPVGANARILGVDRGTIAAAETFGSALVRMIADPAAALAAGRRLRRYIDDHHSIAATTRMHEMVYRQITNSKAP